MSAEYTVPALREQAAELRKRAEGVTVAAQAEADRIVGRAQGEAEKLREAAAEIDAIADGQMSTEPEPPFTMPCWNCNQPIRQDSLGWGHVHPNETACQVPGPDEHTATRSPAAGTVAAGAGVTGEVAQP
jgi:hypothetical protein